MTAPVPSGSYSVMAQRREPPDSLDFFPTPPYATRALFPFLTLGDSVWEPACGEGHMSEVLKEHFPVVRASDVFDYGRGYEVGSFIGTGLDTLQGEADWIVTNPPFNLAAEFAHRGLRSARIGVALLTRTAWLEGSKRWSEIFVKHPPAIVALFVERVAMVKGRWDPKASTATSYSWIIWWKDVERETGFQWIPPGRRAQLTKPDDVARFAARAA